MRLSEEGNLPGVEIGFTPRGDVVPSSAFSCGDFRSSRRAFWPFLEHPRQFRTPGSLSPRRSLPLVPSEQPQDHSCENVLLSLPPCPLLYLHPTFTADFVFTSVVCAGCQLQEGWNLGFVHSSAPSTQNSALAHCRCLGTICCRIDGVKRVWSLVLSTKQRQRQTWQGHRALSFLLPMSSPLPEG